MAKHQQLVSAKDSLGVVKTTKAVTIPANGRALVHGFSRASTPCMRITVALDELCQNTLPGGLVVTPSVTHLYPGHCTNRVAVEVTNYSAKDVVIPAKATVCGLHHVDVVPPCSPTTEQFSSQNTKVSAEQGNEFLDQFKQL
jgi:uridylate kinase